MSDTQGLIEFCVSDNQRNIVEARGKGWSWDKIREVYGNDPANARRAVNAIKKRAAQAGWSPDHDMTHAVPDGYHVRGVSTLYDSDGNPKAQWVKSQITKEQEEQAIKGLVEGLTADIKPAKPKKLPKARRHNKDLMTGIFIGDAHIGMRAFGVETKHSDFDVDIAVQQLRDAVDYLVERAESTETGLLVDVGDFMHANTQHNTTFSGTPLDVDTRHYRVMKAAGEVMAYMVDRMLDKFKRVVLVIARGNHNTDAAGAMQLMMEFYYKDEKRVNVLPTDGFYHYIEYGKWLLGIHHGDKQKPEALAASMARDMPEAWGRTTSRMFCTGHFHKEAVKTLPGVKHKVFAALPPPDSWHASHGFAGDGEMEMLTFRREGGLHSSYTFNVPQPRVEPDARLD